MLHAQRSSEHRSHTEYLEEISGDHPHGDLGRLAAAGERHTGRRVGERRYAIEAARGA
jgi:hypothetical protein